MDYMQTAKKVVAIVFGVSVVIFSLLAILGIWEVVDKDVSEKALGTLGVVLIATFISSVILNNLSKSSK